MSNFGYGLRDACIGNPIDLSRLEEHFRPDIRHFTDSANLKLGAIPAVGLTAFRLKDLATVELVLDWSAWYCGQPLDENEALNPLYPYRDLIDTGTYALALLASLTGRDDLESRLLQRDKASIGHMLLGAFVGPAKELTKLNPPADRPCLLVADGPPYRVKGAPSMPFFAAVGMRGCVREPAPGGHVGPFPGYPGYQAVMVAAALRKPHDAFWWGSNRQEPRSTYQEIRIRRPSLLPWGLSDADAALGVAYLANPQDHLLAREIARWTAGCLPVLPFSYIQRRSGAKEVVMRRSSGSSTGAMMVCVVMADGTTYYGSADDGQRGGPADQKFHHQPQEVLETPTEWICQWISGEGRKCVIPRPPVSDEIVWRYDTDGEGGAVFSPDTGAAPGPSPVTPPTDPKDPATQRESRWRFL